MKKAAIRFLSLILAFVLAVLAPAAEVRTVRADALIPVEELRVTLSIKEISLLPSSTERQVMDRIRTNAGTTTEGVWKDITNTWLEYQNGSKIDGVGQGTDKVDAARNYYIGVTFGLESGYCWPAAVTQLNHNKKALSSVSFPVYFNGSKVSSGYISYNSYYDSVNVDIPVANPVSAAKLAVSGKKTYEYDGKKHGPVLKDVSLYGEKLPSSCYKVYFTDSANKKIQPPKKPGKYYLTVEGKGILKGVKRVAFTIKKAPNTLKASGKTRTVSAAVLKEKSVNVFRKNVITVTKAKGKVTYHKISGSKKITVSKNGTVTLKKGLKKGTYRIGIKVTAEGNDIYKKKTKTVCVTITVK